MSAASRARRKKALRVLLLVHEDLVPPESLEGLDERDIQTIRTEYDVLQALEELGHEVRALGVSQDFQPIRLAVQEFQPDVIFNLLMEFRDIPDYQVHVVSYLELLRVAYTGCNPRGLWLARDKPLTKQILRYHRVRTPAFLVVRRGRKLPRSLGLRFPMIVKSASEDASFGISQASVVDDETRLAERVAFIHGRVGTDALVEEYIAGRELTLSMLGNERIQTFPIWELSFKRLPEGSEPIATARVKWDPKYQEKVGVRTGPARKLPDGLAERIPHLGRRVYRSLGLSGFARIDLRLRDDGRVFVIEANALPDLAHDEDFALAARAAGCAYPALIQRIVNLGLRYRPPWEGS